MAEAGEEPLVAEGDRTTGLAEAGKALAWPKREDGFGTVLFFGGERLAR